MEFFRQQNAQKLNDPGKEQISLCGKSIGSFAISNPQSVF